MFKNALLATLWLIFAVSFTIEAKSKFTNLNHSTTTGDIRALTIEKTCEESNLRLKVIGGTAPYKWFKDNVEIAGEVVDNYLANTSGDYKVVDANNEEATVTYLQPTASFTLNASGNACGAENVQFTNTSTNGASYLWDFGDGTTSTDQSPSHSFTANTGSGTQTFNVTLKVTNADGCSITSVPQSIGVKQLPDAKLGGTGALIYDGKPYFRVCAGTSSIFNFTNPSTTNNVNYIIDWGDGSVNFNSNSFNTAIQHSYPVGTHNLTYTVTGQNGCSRTINYFVFVGTNPAGNISALHREIQVQ